MDAITLNRLERDEMHEFVDRKIRDLTDGWDGPNESEAQWLVTFIKLRTELGWDAETDRAEFLIESTDWPEFKELVKEAAEYVDQRFVDDTRDAMRLSGDVVDPQWLAVDKTITLDDQRRNAEQLVAEDRASIATLDGLFLRALEHARAVEAAV